MVTCLFSAAVLSFRGFAAGSFIFIGLAATGFAAALGGGGGSGFGSCVSLVALRSAIFETQSGLRLLFILINFYEIINFLSREFSIIFHKKER